MKETIHEESNAGKPLLPETSGCTGDRIRKECGRERRVALPGLKVETGENSCQGRG
jgi:hypothetical protein